MDEKETKKHWLKLRTQFFHRRDVVEGTDIKSLPKNLIEAVKGILKEGIQKKKTDMPEKIALSRKLDASYKKPYVTIAPKIKT